MYNYFVHYYDHFGNTYRLFYAPVGMQVPADWEQISIEHAISLCKEERIRRKNNPSSSGYADISIYPVEVANLPQDAVAEIVKPYKGYLVPLDCIKIY